MSSNPYDPGTVDYYRYQINSSRKSKDQLLQDQATQSIAASAFQSAQATAQEDAISTGKSVELTQDRIDAAKNNVMNKYISQILPGYANGPGETVVPERKVYSVPVRDQQAEADNLRNNYAGFQAANAKGQAQFLGGQKKQALQQANLNRYNQSLQDMMNSNSQQASISPSIAASQTDKPDEYPHEQFQPTLAEQVYRGTVGHLGEFASDIFDFNAKHTSGDYSQGAAKTSRTIRDATSLEGLGNFYDFLGNLTGSVDYKNAALHAKHESQLEGGQASGGALSELLATGSQKTGYGKDQNTDASVAALQKQRTERPIEYVAATATDILPALLSIGSGKGSPSVKPARSLGSRFVQRAYADNTEPIATPTSDNIAPSTDQTLLTDTSASTPTSTFDNTSVSLGTGPTDTATITQPFTSTSVDLGTGVGQQVQIPEFKNVTIDLGTSSVTGLGEVGSGTGGSGGGSPPGNGGTFPKFIPTKNIKPEDFGYKETPQKDGTVTLTKLVDPQQIQKTAKVKSKPADLVGTQSLRQYEKGRTDQDLQQSLQIKQTVSQEAQTRTKTKTKPAQLAGFQQLEKMTQKPVQISVVKTQQAQKQQTLQKQLFQPVQVQKQKQKQATSQAIRLDQIVSTGQITRTRTKTTPAFGSMTRTITIPSINVPTRTKPTNGDPFSRLITRTPPPPRTPPTRTPPPSRPSIKVEPPKVPSGSSLGLVFGVKGKSGKTDTSKLGVANPLLPSLDITARKTGKYGANGMFGGTSDVKIFGSATGKGNKDLLGLGSLGKGFKPRKGKKSAFGGLL